MKEISSFKGPFDKWQKQLGTRRRFLETAAEIINSNVHYGVSVYVHFKDFEYVNQQYDLDSFISSPYALAGRSCIAEANTASREGSHGPIDMKYVFERGGPDVAGLVKSVIRLTPVLLRPSFKPSMDKKGERGLVQLQAADYLAYEIRKYIKDHPKYRSGKSFPRGSLRALTATAVRRRFWNVERLQSAMPARRIQREIDMTEAKSFAFVGHI